MAVRRRGLAAALALVTGAALAPLAAVAPAEAATTCTAAQLAGKLGTSDGAAGTIYNVFVLTNVSGTTCSMSGYPGIARFGANGRPQTTNLARDIDPRPTTVTLAPNAKASFVWAYTDVPSGSATDCGTTRVLGISAPGSTSRLYMATKIPQCSKKIRVSAVASGVISPG